MYFKKIFHISCICLLLLSCGNFEVFDSNLKSNLSSDKIFKLQNNWQIFPNALIISEPSSTNSSKTSFKANIPFTWGNNSLFSSEQFKGYGSFKYELSFNEKAENLCLFMRDAGTAYSLYISTDGIEYKLFAKAGIVSSTEENANSEFKTMFVQLPHSNKYIFVFEVSDYRTGKCGLWNSPYISSSETILHYYESIIYKDLILLGIFLIAFYYSIIHFIINRDEIEFIFISAISLIFTLRIIILGHYFQHWFPGFFNFDLLFKISYLSMMVSVPIFIKYIETSFSEVLSKRNTYFFYILSFFSCMFIIFVSPYYIERFKNIFWLIIVLSFLYVLTALVYSFFKKHDSTMLSVILGIIFLFIFFIIDIVKIKYFTEVYLISQYGLLSFLFFLLLTVSLTNYNYKNEILNLYAELNNIRNKFNNILKNNTPEISYTESTDLSKNISENSQQKIINAIAYINENFKDPKLSRELIASKIYLSTSRLGKYFLLFTGIKINDYISKIRINYCINQLKNTNKSITEIAFESGFDNISTFNRRFKEYTGTNPKHYKRSRI